MSDHSDAETYTIARVRSEIESNRLELPFKDPSITVYDFADQMHDSMERALSLTNSIDLNFTNSSKSVSNLKETTKQLADILQSAPLTQLQKDCLSLTADLCKDLQTIDKEINEGQAANQQLNTNISVSKSKISHFHDSKYYQEMRNKKIHFFLKVVYAICEQIAIPNKQNNLQGDQVGDLHSNFYSFKLFCCVVLKQLAILQKAYFKYCRECHTVLLILKQNYDNNPGYKLQGFNDLQDLFPGEANRNYQHSEADYAHFCRAIRIQHPTKKNVDRTKLPKLRLIGDRHSDSREGGHFCNPVDPEIIRQHKIDAQNAREQRNARAKAALCPPDHDLSSRNATASISEPRPTTSAANRPTSNRQSNDPNAMASLGKRSPLSSASRKRPPLINQSPHAQDFQGIPDQHLTQVQRQHKNNQLHPSSSNYFVEYTSANIHKFQNVQILYMKSSKADKNDESTLDSLFIPTEHLVKFRLGSLVLPNLLPHSTTTETFILPSKTEPGTVPVKPTFDPEDAASIYHALSRYCLPKELLQAVAVKMRVPPSQRKLSFSVENSDQELNAPLSRPPSPQPTEDMIPTQTLIVIQPPAPQVSAVIPSHNSPSKIEPEQQLKPSESPVKPITTAVAEKPPVPTATPGRSVIGASTSQKAPVSAPQLSPFGQAVAAQAKCTSSSQASSKPAIQPVESPSETKASSSKARQVRKPSVLSPSGSQVGVDKDRLRTRKSVQKPSDAAQPPK